MCALPDNLLDSPVPAFHPTTLHLKRAGAECSGGSPGGELCRRRPCDYPAPGGAHLTSHVWVPDRSGWPQGRLVSRVPRVPIVGSRCGPDVCGGGRMGAPDPIRPRDGRARRGPGDSGAGGHARSAAAGLRPHWAADDRGARRRPGAALLASSAPTAPSTPLARPPTTTSGPQPDRILHRRNDRRPG